VELLLEKHVKAEDKLEKFLTAEAKQTVRGRTL